MNIHDPLSKFLGAYENTAWMFHAVLVLMFAFVLYAVSRTLLFRACRKLCHTHNVWDDSFIKALRKPLSFTIWFVAVSFSVQYFLVDVIGPSTLASVKKTREVGIVVLGIWFVWRFITNVEKKMVIPYTWRKPSDPTTVSIVARLVRIFVVLIGVLLIMQAFGVPVTGLWAFGGGGTIVIGIAAQDLLANFFGGLMIFLDRPFSVGDWINSPERNIEGTVEYIGWRTTRVLTFDKRPLYLPNSIFTKIAIVNPQRMSNRRIKTTVGLRYDDADKIKPVVDDIRAMLQSHEAIDQNLTLMVNFVEFGASSLNIELYCFTKTVVWSHWRDAQQDVFLKILDIVAKHGAEVAFPTRTLHVPEPVGVLNDRS